MLPPSELYRFEADGDLMGAEPGVLLVALDGFMDAGRTQGLLVQHLLAAGDAQVVASFDVDQLLDYRGRRPMMTFERNRWVSYDDPSLLLYRMTDRDGHPYYLLTGPEPDCQWERFCEAVQQLVSALRITLTVQTYGIPMAVPHTRPMGQSRFATDPRLLAESDNPVFGTVQVPGSVASLLHMRLGESGYPAVGFAIHVPHYLAQGEFPDAAIEALNAIADHTGLNLPNDSLVAAAGATRAQIGTELADNEEATQVVRALEQQYDAYVAGTQRPSLLATEREDLPSAEELGAEFEDFLRGMDDSGDAR